MRDQRNPYDILQVSPYADPDVIEAAFRRLYRKYRSEAKSDPISAQKLQEINWAYEVLRDPTSRRNLDSKVEEDDPDRRMQGSQAPIQGSRPTADPVRAHPSTWLSVLIGTVLLAMYYGFWRVIEVLGSSQSLVILVFPFLLSSLVATIILSIAAAKGWKPGGINIWRFLLMVALSAFPIFAWIPCYLAGKWILRRAGKESISQSSRLPLVIFGVASTLLAVVVFGEIFQAPQEPGRTVDFTTYSDPDVGVQFDYPSYLDLTLETSQERTEIGTIFKVTTILAESNDPTVALNIQIIEDPTRNEMFPELYPPDEDALRLLAMMDMANFQFEEDELPQDKILEAYEIAEITTIDGNPAAEYSLRPRDTSMGNAYIRGAFIYTDEWDISLIIIGSIEENVSGSITEEEIDKIWSRVESSINFIK